MKPTLALIGTDNLDGREIAGLLSRTCRLLIYSERNFEADTFLDEIKKLNPEADAEKAESAVDASWEAEIILLGMVNEKTARAAAHIKAVVCQKIIILTERSLQVELQKILPHSKIIYIDKKDKSVYNYGEEGDQEAQITLNKLLFPK